MTAATVLDAGSSALRQDLVKVLGTLRQIAGDDPLVNPIRRLALDLSRRIEAGDLPLPVIDGLIQDARRVPGARQTAESLSGRNRSGRQ